VPARRTTPGLLAKAQAQPRNRLFERHRIASASIPARVLAAGAGDVRSVPGTGELHAGLDDVL